MAGYIGSKAVLLSTTAAEVSGDADIGGSVLVDTIKADNGTTAMTIDSSGNVTAPVSIGNVGSVLQTVTSSTATQVTTTESNFATPTDTGLAATITPKFSSSKILIIIHASIGGSSAGIGVNMSLKRGGSLLPANGTLAGDDAGLMAYGIGRANGVHETFACNYLDSPSSSSSTEYRLFITRYGGSGTATFNWVNEKDSSSITLMEIKQ